MTVIAPMTRDESLGIPQPLASPEQEHILCVSEDPAITQRDLLPMLQAAGYRVRLLPCETGTGREVLDRPYALILFDIFTQDSVGYTLCQQMRNATALPIMLVLRGAARNDVLRGFESGSDAYVAAPFDAREFLARMHALRRRPLQRPPMV